MTDTQELPVFPLATVLFPDGLLPLRIFEPRYRRMINDCINADHGFAVNLITQGTETGRAAEFAAVGTRAEIVDWSRNADGVLSVTAQGSERVQVVSHRVEPDQLVQGVVIPVENELATGIAEKYRELVLILQETLRRDGGQLPDDQLMQDATWVGFRLAERMPIPAARKQWLLELTNPSLRLEALLQLVAELRDDKPS